MTVSHTGATLDKNHAHPSRGKKCANQSGHSAWRTLNMAKALLGHVGGPDPRMVSEMRRLQQRIRDLEAELTRLQAQNAELTGNRDEEFTRLQDREPALT
ncbi:hypothetical protein GCM10027187_17430 [Streptosporangium sandarakinum]